MPTTLQTTKSREMTVSELISVNVPNTNDIGDALGCAAKIARAAHKACCADRELGFTYQCFAASVAGHIERQHVAYLKGN